jgi:hypothetical protein
MGQLLHDVSLRMLSHQELSPLLLRLGLQHSLSHPPYHCRSIAFLIRLLQKTISLDWPRAIEHYLKLVQQNKMFARA